MFEKKIKGSTEGGKMLTERKSFFTIIFILYFKYLATEQLYDVH